MINKKLYQKALAILLVFSMLFSLIVATDADNADISEYAKDAVIWNFDNGIMFGNDDNTFASKDNTTRAQAAAVFERIMPE